MIKILFGVGWVVGGMSGLLVLRGTHSGSALVVVGVMFIAWGVAEELSSGRWSRRPNTYGVPERRVEPRLPASELEEWITRELGPMRKPQDLIAQVCERSGLSWTDAKALIERVQARDRESIQRSRRRMGLAIALSMLVGGGVFMAASGFAYIHKTMVIPGTEVVHPWVYIGFVSGFLAAAGGLIGLLRGE